MIAYAIYDGTTCGCVELWDGPTYSSEYIMNMDVKLWRKMVKIPIRKNRETKVRITTLKSGVKITKIQERSHKIKTTVEELLEYLKKRKIGKDTVLYVYDYKDVTEVRSLAFWTGKYPEDEDRLIMEIFRKES